ncbi:allantoate amidohydrolase [Caulobacter vibrioides]|uniref:allantoate amidohydrolase n=1 Tax=Caulobacter vibrioides TaxID=155892 RepID=UPI000BB46EC9|nr:allantoate amidohydrolase [Caulobacter vibrioides]ATC25589.1 allantoate amidohydrolase [Caulobacter vibrioides]AZH13680.1 allantoate amidohydrolase [Caulobacter vibrioides]PLR14551.1 allantoate amidohydrolase [Caulobacter vibrioides]
MADGVDIGVRAKARCDALGSPPYSEIDGQLTRRFLTAAHGAALDALAGWMAEAGMRVRRDAAANLIGRYEGETPDAPALIIGSHIDSVRNGGRYDGPLGIMLGIDVVEALHRAGRRLHFAIEVVAFGDEEGSRFPASMSCSRAIAGTLDATALEMKDAEGITVAEALTAFGGDPANIASAARRPEEVLAFLEAHIEQGPVLEAEGLALGVVTAIAAQKRLMVRITGMAGHAGTTPMALRKDPGPAAAEAILALERICRAGTDGLVGTVGRMTALPGAFNVIPGAIEFSMDIRAETSATRDAAVEAITAEIHAIAAARDLSATVTLMQALAESPCDPSLMGLLDESLADLGLPARRLPSGAGHDAMVMAALCPTAMLFIRCEGGISHNPAEAVTEADCALAAKAMLGFVEKLAANPLRPSRPLRGASG